jgi:hypothetical protein
MCGLSKRVRSKVMRDGHLRSPVGRGAGPERTAPHRHTAAAAAGHAHARGIEVGRWAGGTLKYGGQAPAAAPSTSMRLAASLPQKSTTLQAARQPGRLSFASDVHHSIIYTAPGYGPQPTRIRRYCGGFRWNRTLIPSIPEVVGLSCACFTPSHCVRPRRSAPQLVLGTLQVQLGLDYWCAAR